MQLAELEKERGRVKMAELMKVSVCHLVSMFTYFLTHEVYVFNGSIRYLNKQVQYMIDS